MAARSPLNPVSRNNVSVWEILRDKFGDATKEKGSDYGAQAEPEFHEFYDLVRPVLPFDLNRDQRDEFGQIFYLYQTLVPGVFHAFGKHQEEFREFIEGDFRRGAFGEAENFDVQVFFRRISWFNHLMNTDKIQITVDTKEEGSDYSVQSEYEFIRIKNLVRPVLFDLNQDQLDEIHQTFFHHRAYAPAGCRAIWENPEKFREYIRREFRRGAFGEAENFNVALFVLTILTFSSGSTKTNEIQIPGLRPNSGAALSGSPARGHSSAQGLLLVDVGEEVKENFSPDLVIRDPILFKTLFKANLVLWTGMIYKYTTESLPAEISQSLAISSATVGVLATGTALYLIISQRRSLPFGFEREVSIQTLENVGFSATGIAFIVGMLLLLPNNLSRCIVGGVLCAVFLIIIFAKLRPKREAKTELVSSQRPTDLASNLLPSDFEIELADLSECI